MRQDEKTVEKLMKEGKACYMCGSTENLFFDGDGLACKECHKEDNMSKKDSEKDLAIASRVKEFVEWFNSLDDDNMEKVLDRIDEMRKGVKICA